MNINTDLHDFTVKEFSDKVQNKQRFCFRGAFINAFVQREKTFFGINSI